ncbi:TetR/AcrR family transcriptional regulator [Nocardia sp. NPDC055321]
MTAAPARSNHNGTGSLDDDLTRRRRKEISLGACAVFDERGYANTRIADISAHLGIGQGTIYKYFTGKDDLMDYIIGYAVRRMLAAMREDPVVGADGTGLAHFRDQIAAVAHRLLDMAATEPVLIRVLLIQAPAARPAAIDELVDQLSATTAAYLRTGADQGYLREGLDVTAVADAMTGIAVPAMRRVLRGDLDAAARAATAGTIGELITTGITAG